MSTPDTVSSTATVNVADKKNGMPNFFKVLAGAGIVGLLVIGAVGWWVRDLHIQECHHAIELRHDHRSMWLGAADRLETANNLDETAPAFAAWLEGYAQWMRSELDKRLPELECDGGYFQPVKDK